MSRVRTITGALVLCALALCAFGVASASAVGGLTAVHCQAQPGTGLYATSECETPTKTGQNFETVPFALNTPTAVEGTGVVETTLTGTVALAKTDISCKKSTVTGTVTNKEGATEMQIEGTKTVVHYEQCTARLQSDTGVNKEACKVKAITGGQGEGKITTVSLKSLTAANHVVTIEPTEGTTFSEFEIIKEAAEAGKSCALPTTKVTVTGKLSGTANTENHSNLTIAGGGPELKANGAAATLTGTTANHTPAPNTAVKVGAMTSSVPSPSNLTAVECEAKAGGTYGTSACLTPKSGSGFETEAITEKLVEGTLTPAGTEAVLTLTVALSKTDISCKKSTTTGTVKNIEGGSPVEMQVEITGAVTHYEECTARLASDTGVNKEACKVKAITGGQGVGKITTVSLKGKTGPEHTFSVEPTEGTTFTEFEIIKEAAEAGKTCAMPAAKVTLTGKVSGTVPTDVHSHVTFAGGGTELNANGAAATYTATYGCHTPAPNQAVVCGAQAFP